MCRCPEGLGGDAFTQCQPILQGWYICMCVHAYNYT
jgi:hypothetical protein